MAKILLSILVLLIWTDGCLAQIGETQTLEKLHKNLKKTKADTSRVLVLTKIGKSHLELSNRKGHSKSLDSALLYIQKAESLSQSLNFQKGIGESYIELSKIYNKQEKKDKSVEFSEKALALYKKQGTKSELANAYMALMSSTEFTVSLQESIVLVEKALELYKQDGNNMEHADALHDLAYLHMSEGKVKLALDEWKESLVLYKKADFEQVQRVHSLIAIGYNELGKMDEALDSGLKAVQLMEKFNDNSNEAAEAYNYVGIIYSNLKDTEKANYYFQKAHRIAKNYDDTGLVIMLETNIVQTLMNLKRNKEALVYLKEMEKSYSILQIDAQLMLISRCILAYTNLKEFKNAEKYVNIAMQMSDKLSPADFNQSLLYPGIVKYHFETKQYDIARKYVNKYKKLGEKGKNIKVLKEIHRMLFQLDSAQARFDLALANFKIKEMYEDSLFNETSQKQIAELQIKYDTEKKDKDLLLKEKNNFLLRKQGELQESKLSQANLMKDISLGSIVFLIVIVTLLYSRYRIKQRTNRLLETQKKEINQKNSVLQKLVSEKEWLLKEIHHRVKNNLQMVMSLLNTQSHYLKDDAAMVAIKNSQHRIHSMSLIHKKLYQSDNVISIDMSIYIQELIEYFKLSFDTGQRIRFVTNIEAVEMDTSQAVPLGLIINEAITNSIKHAFPDDREGVISVLLERVAANRFRLVISDNGVGMPDGLDKRNFLSLGMRLIKGLSDDLDAKLVIENKDGLKISVEFAYDEKILTTDINELSA